MNAGPAQYTVICVYSNGSTSPHILCRLWCREINGICRAYINTGGTSSRTFLCMEGDLSFEDLVNCNCLFRTVLHAPLACAAVFLDDIDFSKFFLSYYSPCDFDRLFRTGLCTDITSITVCFVPDNFTLHLARLRAEWLVENVNGFTQVATDTTLGTLIIINDKFDLEFDGLPFCKAFLVLPFKQGDITVNCITWTYIITDVAPDTFVLVNCRSLVIGWESFLFKDRQTFFAINFQSKS